MAVNLDHLPGPDGFALKIYASIGDYPRPVPITTGTLAVLMYEGALSLAELGKTQPRRTWSVPAADLKPLEVTSTIGVSYQLTPSWGEDRPSASQVTLLVRYVSPEGRAIFSSPCTISVPGK